jgi:tetratricopeptide (TPR) repeat protein
VIEGTVRDASGKPVAGASIVLMAAPVAAGAAIPGTAANGVAPQTLTQKTPTPQTPMPWALATKTGKDGTFTFSAIRAGQYTLKAEDAESHAAGSSGAASRESAPRSLELSAGEKKHIDLVLVAPVLATGGTGNAAQGGSSADAMQFADQPNFTVAGMTDWSNFGLHGSDATARTSEALTKETLALKSGGSRGNTGSAADANRVGASAHTSGAAGDPAAAHRVAGDRDEKLGDPVAAVHEYETAARLDASEENYFAWGSELLLHRAAQAAAEVFAKGAAGNPDSARMLAGLGAALYADGRYEEAASKLCAASDLDPADAAPYLFLGKMEETATAPIPCGEVKLARFAREQPGNALANYYYALSLTKRERVSENPEAFRTIETLLEKAVTADPQLGEAYVQLGILYSAKGDFARAEEVLTKAIAANPELGLAHYRLGQAYKRTGEEAKAQQEFAMYARCEKTEAEARKREQRELRQFLVILKEEPAVSPPR